MILRYVTMSGADASSQGFTTIGVAVSVTSATICALPPTLLYISDLYSDIQTGITLYTNMLLTIPLTGFSFVKDSSGMIYNLDPSTGVVGASTGVAC